MPKERVCATCSSPFVPNSNRQKYCPACGRRGTAVCENCKKPFTLSANTTGRWCSRGCWSEGTSTFGHRTCPACGNRFKPRNPHHMTCSRKCRGVRIREQSAARRLVKNCAVCGDPFDATYHQQQQMCSIKCRTVFRSSPRQRCERCNKQMDTTNSSYRKQRFCSAECRTTPDGTLKRTSGGYMLIKASSHQGADHNGYIGEHRMIVEQQIGRLLEPHERVHHKNGVRHDNRPENLELWKVKGKKDPSGVRSVDYHCPGCRCGQV